MHPALFFILVYLPALVANGSATLISRGHPLDFGKRFIDGRRILGDGKTFEGFTIGLLYATSVSLTEALAAKATCLAVYGVAAGLGALLGDILGSFIKRRVGLERGARAPLLDQLDFLIGAYLATTTVGYIPPLLYAVLFAILVYGLHRATNYAAYRLGIKQVPW